MIARYRSNTAPVRYADLEVDAHDAERIEKCMTARAFVRVATDPAEPPADGPRMTAQEVVDLFKGPRRARVQPGDLRAT